MKTYFLFIALVLSLTCARAQPTETQQSWTAIIESNNIKGAEEMSKEPGFDPLLPLPALYNNALGAALSKNRVKIAGLMIDSAPSDAYLRNDQVLSGLGNAENFAILKRLVAMPKFDVNAGAGTLPLLCRLAEMGNMEGVKLLLKNPKIKPMARDVDGNTALHAVNDSRSGSIAGVLLADKRIDPNAQNKKGDTALHEAADYGDVKVLKRLLADPRTDPNRLNKKKQSPLMVAARCDMELVTALMSSKKLRVSAKEKAQIQKLKKAGGYIGGSNPG